MKKLLFLSIISFLGACKLIKTTKSKLFSPKKEKTATVRFPQDWVGNWSGNLQIFNAQGKLQEVEMQLKIAPLQDKHYTWTIIYGNAKDGTRAYELITIDSAKGHYRIDEKDGILLDCFYLNNTLYSRFSVQEVNLMSRESYENGVIYYEITSGSDVPLHTSGGGTEDEPAVTSFPIKTLQKAILRRAK